MSVFSCELLIFPYYELNWSRSELTWLFLARAFGQKGNMLLNFKARSACRARSIALLALRQRALAFRPAAYTDYKSEAGVCV
jgi:hypothetical protein